MNYKRFALFTLHFALFTLLCISGYCQKLYYVSTLAGDTSDMYKGLDSNAGYHDGAAGSALFNAPTGIAVDASGNVYVADTYNNIIREINVTTNSVTTIAGDTADIKKGLDSNIGYLNGARNTAMFNNPWGVCVDDSGNVYVADTYNSVIRKISASTGMVSTYAGKDSSGITFDGYVNGPDSLAEFFTPVSLAVDASGNIYVADNGNNAIREIWASTHQVTTIAGRGPDSSGYINGRIDTAEFTGLFGIALGKAGAVFVTQAESGTNAIRRLYHDTVTTYSSFDTVGIDTNLLSYSSYPVPSGYENGKDSIYIRGDTIVLDDTTSLVGGAVLYNDPAGITFDTAGNLLVADEYNNVIRKVNVKDTVVSTYAGNYANNYDSITFRNGWDSLAVFYNPVGIAADKKGNIYVTDAGNNLIRKIALTSIVGIKQLPVARSSLSVYPNPSNGVFTFQWSVVSGQLSVSVYNVLGGNIFASTLPPPSGRRVSFSYPINISSQPNGVYFYRVVAEDGSLVGNGKVVIQK